MVLRTNIDKVIEQAVLGKVSSPQVQKGREWRIGTDGVPHSLPGVGGITYNLKVGHSALNWAADHVEPGVSLKAEDDDANRALNMLACVGNMARVVSGAAEGAMGVVTGKHGGIEHVLLDFPDETLEKLVIGDKIQVRTAGLGLQQMDFEDIGLMNMSPHLLEKLELEKNGDRLRIPVAHKIPAAFMGSGIGHSHAFSGDYDLQTSDHEAFVEAGLDTLRIGDMVALIDQDHTYGRSFKTGAISVGVVVHSCCVQAGHGPGITTLFTSASGAIEPVIDPEANLAKILGVGTERS
jgi:hypothetical protein